MSFWNPTDAELLEIKHLEWQLDWLFIAAAAIVVGIYFLYTIWDVLIVPSFYGWNPFKWLRRIFGSSQQSLDDFREAEAKRKREGRRWK